ncbi:MAG TPA: hypothetical protein PKM21_19300 [Anaerolineales bacterium]|nr:hypothetical protein [Anaerolineales bacterium]
MGVPLGACRNQDSVDGYNEGWLTPDEAPLNPYYNWAIGIGYSVSWYEFEDYGAKYAMAQTMAGEMEASNDIYILVGHSAGADAVILAADMVRYKDIDSIAVLDPTLTATIPPSQTGTSILDMANQVAANLPVFLGDTPSDGNITITGAGRYPYDYSHLGLAVADDVFMDAHNYLKWK